MRILALIPARGGSKRLPGKNIRPLGGKPLIVWSIEVAAAVPEICDILVSTDDAAIAAVCAQAGALVPWLRPAALATDTAGSLEVALHALDWYERAHGAVDGLLLLQPTSPFRSVDSVRRGIALFAGAGALPVVGVSPSSEHPLWTFKLEDGQLQPYVDGAGAATRSQDLPAAYVLNGSFYLVAPAQLRAQRGFIGPRTLPLVIASAREALDIDTPWDWALAESALAPTP
ncbi:MAG: acylneuraminate cytidylyltransferase family protein [Pseudomonadota bacterium]